MTVIVFGIVCIMKTSVRHAKFMTDDIAAMTLSVQVLERCSFSSRP